MCANPFETLGLDPLLIAEVKNSRNPEEFKKFLKEYRDNVAMALHPDRLKDVNSQYLPAMLEAYDKIKNLENGKLDSAVEEFLVSAAKDDSKDMLIKIDQLANIVENLEQDNAVAKRQLRTLEDRLTQQKSLTEEASSDASMYRQEGEHLRHEIKQERSKHSREIQKIRQGVDRRGFIKGIGVGILAGLIGYGGAKAIFSESKAKPAPSKSIAKVQDTPKSIKTIPVRPRVSPEKQAYVDIATALLWSYAPNNGFPASPQYGEVAVKQEISDFLLKNEHAYNQVRAYIDEFSRLFPVQKSKVPEYAKSLRLFENYVVYQAKDDEPSAQGTFYDNGGLCGIIRGQYGSMLLPNLRQTGTGYEVIFDKLALKAVATGKGKLIDSGLYRGMHSRSHYKYRPLYKMLCDHLGLRPDGGR